MPWYTVNNNSLPLIISITGHRDLVDAERPGLERQVRHFFKELLANYPDYRLTLLNPLAAGADQLVAAIAVELGVDLIVPLPKPIAEYRSTFNSKESASNFDDLCAKAKSVFELALPDNVFGSDNSMLTASEGFPYAQLGVFLSAHCHILLALWDGKYNEELGGTSQVVQFHHEDCIPGLITRSTDSLQMLVDDESDLVYHIVCSRDRVNGAPSEGLQPLDWCWFTKDLNNPRSKTLPDQHKSIFQRGSEFSSDAARYEKHIELQSSSLLDESDKEFLPDGIETIDQLFSIADCLAILYKRRTVRTLLVTHCLAFLMGLMFLLYSDLAQVDIFMALFLLFFASAALIHYVAKRAGWQRKYLDYRTLAEGLRVQFYWAAAGVENATKWKFAHDNFLQSQDPEFGWIRNVMRVAGTRCASNPSFNPEGLLFAREQWVGDAESGQLGYYRKVANERFKADKVTLLLDRLSVLVSGSIIFAFLFFSGFLSEMTTTILFITMGTTLLLYAVREGFTYATAVKELIKQYEFMLRIFDNAHRRLHESEDLDEQRQILLALGQSALEEHSDWILMHRERSLDQSEIWRMGS